MATVTEPTEAGITSLDASSRAADASRFVLQGVSYATYRALRSDLDRAGSRVRLTFDRGTLEIMVTSYKHERGGHLLARLIEAVTAGLRIPLAGAKSMTLSREELDRGIEPDESYYIANEARMRFHDEIDLTDDPPPDLAIEVDVSRSSVNKTSIYASLGVPEFWRWEKGELQILALTPEREYIQVEASVNLPVLSRADVEAWVQKRAAMDETSWFLAILAWAQDELTTRLRDQAGK